MARPTRFDIEMTSGSSQPFEWVLTENGAPRNIDLDRTDFYFTPARGDQSRYQITTLSGAHFDGPNGKDRYTITSTMAPASETVRIGWYEIWLTPNGFTESHPHIVGEVKQFPTIKK